MSTDAKTLQGPPSPFAPSEVFERFDRFVLDAQERVVSAVECLDGERFDVEPWDREQGGGGRMATLRGEWVEKGAVLCSRVHGEDNPLTGRPFVAGGLSLILHPLSPHAPTVHLNVRRFEEEDRGWWGGGIDLTPMGVVHDGDVDHFHKALRAGLGRDYEPGRQAAEEYFFVPHRDRPRGAGGVFFDRVDSGDAQEDFDLMRRVVECFFTGYLPVLERRMEEPFDDAQRAAQLLDRGVYVEFNLLYDRGTRFGFQSGGNPKAILSSLPPLASW